MFAKNYHFHWIAGRANILSKYMIYIFFNFRRGFYSSFPVISKSSSLLLQIKIELIFSALYFYIYELEKRLSDF